MAPSRRASVIRRLLGASVAAGVVAGTASGQGAAPLSTFAAERVAVFPIQYGRADTGAVAAFDWAAVRKAIDDSVGAAIADRGIGKKWAYAGDLVRVAKRNAVYANDPAAVGVGPLRTRALKPDDKMPPVALDNMRTLVALTDTRYALLPVELLVAHRGTDARAIVRLLLVDVRGGDILWYADLPGPIFKAGTPWGAEGIGALAQQVADLVVPR